MTREEARPLDVPAVDDKADIEPLIDQRMRPHICSGKLGSIFHALQHAGAPRNASSDRPNGSCAAISRPLRASAAGSSAPWAMSARRKARHAQGRRERDHGRGRPAHRRRAQQALRRPGGRVAPDTQDGTMSWILVVRAASVAVIIAPRGPGLHGPDRGSYHPADRCRDPGRRRARLSMRWLMLPTVSWLSTPNSSASAGRRSEKWARQPGCRARTRSAPSRTGQSPLHGRE